MCGIGGVFGLSGSIPEHVRAQTRRAAEAMVHRGPDALGEAEGGDVLLLHNRLAIIDLASGAQPMEDPETGSRIVFNGEIYNYVELRRQLEGRGLRFRTSSDTEVLLLGYREFGEAVVDHLNGMFAFAIHDPDRRSLFLARDRFGEKPLHYFVRDGCFHFASELSALRHLTSCPTDISPRGLLEYFAFGAVSSPGTILEGVEQLRPGHTLRVGRDGVSTARYYAREVTRALTHLSDEEIEASLSEAVQIRLRADVPVALLLSGGIDSTLITTLARRAVPGELRTFAFGWAGQPSELPHAREVADGLGTLHHEILLDRGQFARDLPDIVRYMDTPQADSAAVVVYGLSRAIREHGVRVVLSGEGGDELFGGYPWYRGWDGPRARLKRLIRSARLDAEDYVEGRMATPVSDLSAAFGTEPVRGLLLERARDMGPAGTALEGRIAFDYAQFIPSALMPKVDRMSMAHSIEVRAPFLDPFLVDQWASVPPTDKVCGARLKVRIREFGERTGLIPAAVLARPKVGMNLPITWWVRQNEELFRDALSGGRSVAAELFGPAVIAGWFEGLAREGAGGWSLSAQRIWGAGVFELWAAAKGSQVLAGGDGGAFGSASPSVVTLPASA